MQDAPSPYIFSGMPPTGFPSTPSATVDFGDPSSWIPFITNTGLQVYSTVARNNQAGEQISNGQQPTALLVPATPTGTAAGQTTPANAIAALTQTTGLSSGMLFLIAAIIVVILLFKK